jgi:hypothetical protein
MLVAHLTSQPGRFVARTIWIKIYSPLALFRLPTHLWSSFFQDVADVIVSLLWSIHLVFEGDVMEITIIRTFSPSLSSITLTCFFFFFFFFLFSCLDQLPRSQRSVAYIRRRWELSQSHLLIHYSTHPIVPMSATLDVSPAGTGGRVDLSR